MSKQQNILGAFMVPHPPIIVPEVGNGAEKPAMATIEAYKKVAEKIAELKPETIVLTTPHAILYADYIHISPNKTAEGSFGRFRAPQVKFKVNYDEELVCKICENAKKENFPAGIEGDREPELDHAAMVPMYFINQKYKAYKLVRIGLSGLPLKDHYTFGMMVQNAINELGRKTVIVASGDLSHVLKPDGPYGFKPAGPKYDKQLMQVMKTGSFGELFDFSEEFCSEAAECGHRSFVIMSGILDGFNVKPQKLSYEGPFGVGYGVCAYEILDKSEARKFKKIYEERQAKAMTERKQKEDEYIKLARLTIESWVKEHKIIEEPNFITDEMKNKKAGCFVSLHKNGMLRGCIGTIAPTQASIAQEIIHNAISASTRDPRFSPMRAEELNELEISVDILKEPESIKSEAQLDIKRYGVIVTKGYKRGLLLPNLDGISNVQEQIDIAKQKAGILPSDNDVELERFEVIRHEAQ